MRIKIAKEAVCGEIVINAGEYWVALRHERRMIALVAGGKDVLVPAVRRHAKSRSKTTTVSFFTGGGTVWSLLIQDPKYGEWVAFLDYKGKRGSKK